VEKTEVESKLALQFATVHSMLDKILENIPLANSVLPEVLEQKLPSCFGPVQIHFQFVQNILKISERYTSMRPRIMELVMEHLCSIDHLLPKTVLVDIMEEDDSSDEGDSSEMTQTNTKLELAKGLDQMCCHFIQYIDRITQKEDKSKTMLALQVLLREFVPVFEKVFLPQPSTKSVQFILFYLLSLKVTFPDSFIDWLLKRVTSPSEPSLKRQAAAAYLCGICARAEYIQTNTIVYVVKILNTFCIKEPYMTHINKIR
jgi:RNA polymerase I-specific transcription initiation factor RRN3